MSSDDNDLGLDDDNFDSFEKKKMTVGDMWREKPLFKVGAIVAAAVVVFGMIFVFGGDAEAPIDPSSLPAGSEVVAPPGTDEASQAYIEAVKEQNEARTEEAQAQGTSSLPTPIDPPVGRVTQEDDELVQDDPLQRWRALQEERLARELNEAPETVEVQEPPENRAEQVQQMATAMSTQMQAILEKNSEVKTGYRTITDPSFLDELKEKEAAAIAENPDGYTDANGEEISTTGTTIEEILFPAGEIAYGQMITQANSDVEGPVLAQIAGGPLNGARVLGDFTLKEQPELLVLEFDTVIVDGISYDIDAVAIDPGTTLPAMATDVDHHYFRRIILPAAASFVKGMAEAVADSGSTTVVVDAGAAVSDKEELDTEQELAAGVEEGGKKLSTILDWQAAKSKLTVTIDAGTPLGILFLEPVIKRDEETRYSPVAKSTRAVAR